MEGWLCLTINHLGFVPLASGEASLAAERAASLPTSVRRPVSSAPVPRGIGSSALESPHAPRWLGSDEMPLALAQLPRP